MKRVLLAITLALLIPGMLSGQTLGYYFDWQPPGQMAYTPAPFSFFDVYLYLHNSGHDFISAIEYQLVTTEAIPLLFQISEVSYPANMSAELGDPWIGHAISYWPPLDGLNPGYNEMCHYKCFTTEPCGVAGLVNFPLVVGPHPDSGEVRGTYWTEGDHFLFDIDGLTSWICPDPTTVEEKSWGAIKSLYK